MTVSQPTTSTMAPKVKCTLCSKPYSVNYMKRHMKKDHESLTNDVEKGRAVEINVWVENEKDMSYASRDLESFLRNNSDNELRNAAAFAGVIHDVEEQMAINEMDLEQCFEWYDEDHNEAFNFTITCSGRWTRACAPPPSSRATSS